MNELALLGPSARPIVGLGGATAWKTRSIKGILCTFQWLDLRPHGFEDIPEHANVACMVLCRPASQGRGAYVIPQPMAYLFGDNKGNPTPHLLTSSLAAAEQIGFDIRDKMAWKAIIDIIIEGLPDLILMPNEAPEHVDILAKKTIQGIEARATMNGKVIHEEVL